MKIIFTLPLSCIKLLSKTLIFILLSHFTTTSHISRYISVSSHITRTLYSNCIFRNCVTCHQNITHQPTFFILLLLTTRTLHINLHFFIFLSLTSRTLHFNLHFSYFCHSPPEHYTSTYIFLISVTHHQNITPYFLVDRISSAYETLFYSY